MKSLYFLWLLAVGCFALPEVYAQNAASKGSLSDLAFIEGHWKATPEGRTIEASWFPPAGDNIAGMMRMMTNGKVTMYEILGYEKTEQGIVSLVKHFKPGMIGQEDIEKPVRYIFLESSKDRVVFEQDNQQVRVLYEKRSTDAFVISIGRQEEGKWAFKPLFEFSRVK
ncbi:DUF6265 family protein [Rhodocytophaga aerolata]|uniref:DUF6265 family protein n=1 Tax=Rhodocytophaga aerolata TaxID=455078 RepID=A0ABT8R2L2_9BACT|nr:DUF6265 family protein [Rhodocytophaga aerolata]MDO1444880.1 DUF6265 family protein [Rhodocytophaga aerolata]